MQIKRVINIEDNVYKHMAIKRALNYCGIMDVDDATNGDDGIVKIEAAIAEGNPYDLLITDMHFPIHGEENVKAGELVMEELRNRSIDIPVVVCSSQPYRIPGAAHNIFYNERSRDINWDIKEMLDNLRRG